MPEGPEIRTDAEQLDFFLSRRVLQSVELLNPQFEKRCKGLSEFQKALPLTVDRVRSRGKKLFIFFQSSEEEKSERFLVFGYGMTGNIGQEEQKHSHLQFNMGQSWIGFNIWFYSDPRRFGTFEACKGQKTLDDHFSDLAPTVALGYPGEENFQPITRSQFEKNLKNCQSFLAVKLMDQRSICSGVGNYILSEVFHEARLDPFVKCQEIRGEKMDALWNALHKIMSASYKHGGMSMSDYANVNGDEGTFENLLLVYGKEGKFINSSEIHSCKGPHGRTIFFTAENGTETLKKLAKEAESINEEENAEESDNENSLESENDE